ncbi:hypothetical protein BN946_scf185013.g164 [Trametes cinnabarina]|uniref:rRNA-processing protein n=1 Tax=Pycnoporus cinnabarinus TaxID=5643 RepID=A0A060SMR5_PYCCI|nr:hypothetical protein BN946_scf185013.g164 [Trametes cinnabarina]
MSHSEETLSLAVPELLEASTSSSQAGDVPVLPLAQSSAGRVSGKAWKPLKSATVYVHHHLRCDTSHSLLACAVNNLSRSHLPIGVKTKNWEERMEKTKKEQAIKKLQQELKQEKEEEIKRRREVTLERKRALEERQRLEEAKAKMGARRAARLRRKMGRTKKINH